MKANELRLGNYVYDNLGGILKIKGLSFDSDLSHLKGIPLSEEWLIKAGFEKCINGYWSPNEMFNVKFYDDGIEVYLSGGDVNIAVKPLKYLHEAQNLYYSIFGEELEFKI